MDIVPPVYCMLVPVCVLQAVVKVKVTYRPPPGARGGGAGIGGGNQLAFLLSLPRTQPGNNPCQQVFLLLKAFFFCLLNCFI